MTLGGSIATVMNLSIGGSISLAEKTHDTVFFLLPHERICHYLAITTFTHLHCRRPPPPSTMPRRINSEDTRAAARTRGDAARAAAAGVPAVPEEVRQNIIDPGRFEDAFGAIVGDAPPPPPPPLGPGEARRGRPRGPRVERIVDLGGRGGRGRSGRGGRSN